MLELTDWELEKYKRQIQIPDFGVEAQRKLKNAAVLVTRLGGLGGPTALWLAAAGVGKLFIAHGGNVTPSNLNRQILMRANGVGQPRVDQAVETLRRFTTDTEIIGYAADASDENAADWVGQVEVVCDTSPDFTERLILNRECWRQGKVLVDSGMNGMECQLTVVKPPDTPCLQCLVPEVPDWWDPKGFGVLGAVSGALAAMTALEAVKMITGYGTPLLGRMLTFDTEDMTFQTFDLHRRPGCPVCGGP